VAWIILVISGVFEAVWAAALGASNGFRRKLPTLVFALGMAMSMIGLAYAMREIPTGTAYAVWTGVGAALTVVWAIASRRERPHPIKLVLVAVLIACVVGLKAVG
jgi:quaternary ammonium compound-resistance protein SugE